MSRIAVAASATLRSVATLNSCGSQRWSMTSTLEPSSLSQIVRYGASVNLHESVLLIPPRPRAQHRCVDITVRQHTEFGRAPRLTSRRKRALSRLLKHVCRSASEPWSAWGPHSHDAAVHSRGRRPTSQRARSAPRAPATKRRCRSPEPPSPPMRMAKARAAFPISWTIWPP